MGDAGRHLGREQHRSARAGPLVAAGPSLLQRAQQRARIHGADRGPDGIYGQYVEPLAGFQALAGYTTPGPDPNQAALILGNGGRTVFKAFLDGQNDADLDNDGVMDGVELWINMISSMFVCDNPADVPWLSELPTSGTTAAGATTPVQVTFDSTGLAAGAYHANLCIASNDPDPGPGNGTELVVVPVELIVEAPATFDVRGYAFLDTNGDGLRQLSELAGVAGLPVVLTQGGSTGGDHAGRLSSGRVVQLQRAAGG